MNKQIKQSVIKGLYNVLNSAPTPKYNYNQQDLSPDEFNIWIDYVFKTLDIMYNYTGMSVALSTKNLIYQISYNNIPFVQRVDQIKNQLINLIQVIM